MTTVSTGFLLGHDTVEGWTQRPELGQDTLHLMWLGMTFIVSSTVQENVLDLDSIHNSLGKITITFLHLFLYAMRLYTFKR